MVRRWTAGELLTLLNGESAKQVDDAGGGRRIIPLRLVKFLRTWHAWFLGLRRKCCQEYKITSFSWISSSSCVFCLHRQFS